MALLMTASDLGVMARCVCLPNIGVTLGLHPVYEPVTRMLRNVRYMHGVCKFWVFHSFLSRLVFIFSPPPLFFLLLTARAFMFP